MSKNAFFKGYKSNNSIKLGRESEALVAFLAGQTIGQLGKSLDMDGVEFDFRESNHPTVAGQVIRNLYVDLRNAPVDDSLKAEWQIGVSRGFKWDNINDAEYLMDCMFRANFKQAVDTDNNILDGKFMDGTEGREMKRVISIGNPSGLTKTGEGITPFAEENQDATTNADGSVTGKTKV